MLYTLSKAEQTGVSLTQLLTHLQASDAVILWQDGVLQAVKNPDFFTSLPNVFVLEQDVQARGLTLDPRLPQISLTQLVQLTEQCQPQIAL